MEFRFILDIGRVVSVFQINVVCNIVQTYISPANQNKLCIIYIYIQILYQRYADRAKKIKNKAVVNENPMDKLIRELKEENERLKKAMGGDLPAGGATMTEEGLSSVDLSDDVLDLQQ